MDWKQYEQEIYELMKAHYPAANITQNASLEGKSSKTKRQIDILIEERIAGNLIRIAIDAKFRSKKVDVKDVESFISMLKDVGAHKGLIISQKGFTKAALQRAYNEEWDVEVDILNFDDLKRWQGFGAFPYSGNNCVFLQAPFGWIIDAGQHKEVGIPALAFLYQRGFDLKDAIWKHGEFMYVNFWNRKKDNKNLDQLINLQEQGILESSPDATFEYQDTIQREDGRTRLRILQYRRGEPYEYTGYVEFADFIFFCVLICPLEVSKRNIRKLESILQNIKPGKFKHTES